MREPFDDGAAGQGAQVSIGAAIGVPGDAVDDVLATADLQMYSGTPHHIRPTFR